MKRAAELLRTVIETAQNGAINGDPECRQFFIDPYSNFRGMCAYMGLEPDIVARKVLAKTKRDIRFRLKSEGYKSSYYYNNLERERRRARERYRSYRRAPIFPIVGRTHDWGTSYCSASRSILNRATCRVR